MDDSGLHGGFDWENAEDVTALSEEDLRGRLEDLSEEERAVSYRRRILQGRIDLIRAELLEQGAVALSPEDLARVLLGDSPDEEIR
jgi:RsiG-like